jgi:hypothetical protein
MKEIIASVVFCIIYVIVWKINGFELAVLAGISQILGTIVFKK